MCYRIKVFTGIEIEPFAEIEMTKKAKDRDVKTNLRVEAELHKAFNLAARLRGDTMTGVLTKYMRQVVQEERSRDERRFDELLAALHEEKNSDGEPELSLKVDKAKPHNHK